MPADLKQLEAALRAADAAGNVEDARRLAQAYAAARTQPKADFSSVQGDARTVAAPTSGDFARQAYDDSPALLKPFISAGAELTSLGRGIGQFLTPNDSAIHQRLTDAANADAPYQSGPHGLSAVAGRALPYLATLPLGGPAVGTAGRVALAAGEGAAYGGLQQTGTGESRLANALTGAALGGGGAATGGLLALYGKSAAKAIRPEVRALYDKAKAFGITLTPAQLSDSRLMKYLSHQFGMLPFSGGAARTEQQAGQFNRKLAEQIGVDAPAVTPEVYAAKKAADSAKFDELTGRNNLMVDAGLVQKLQNLVGEADIVGVGDQARKAVSALYAKMDANQTVPGRAYQGLDSVLGKATKAGDTASHYVGAIRNAIREAMDASISPQDAAAWSQLRREYANRKTIAPLVAKSDGGPLPPAQLMGRVTANNAGKERMASNRGGTMGDLARVGQAMKPPPSSGTGERVLVNQLLQPWLWPGLVAGASAGRASNSPLLAEFLMRQGRGQGAQRLGQGLQRHSPLLALLLGQQEPTDTGDGP